MFQFRCEVCDRLRPEDEIEVLKGDASFRHDLPEGTVTRNVNYCFDSADCRQGAAKILNEFVEGFGSV